MKLLSVRRGVLLDPPTLRQPGLNEDAQTV
jgi:hypothetical protein